MKTTLVLLCALAVLALPASPAHATGGHRSTIVMDLVPAGDASASCPASLFGIAFDLTSTGGGALGTGRSCVDAIDGCDPFRPFCHQAVTATFTLELARGSVTVPMALHEIWPTADSFLQLGHGTVAAGTGAYSRATGHLTGGGGGRFFFNDSATTEIYTLDLRSVR